MYTTIEKHFLSWKEAQFITKARKTRIIIGQEVADLLDTIAPSFHEAPTIVEPAHSGYTTVKLPVIEL